MRVSAVARPCRLIACQRVVPCCGAPTHRPSIAFPPPDEDGNYIGPPDHALFSEALFGGGRQLEAHFSGKFSNGDTVRQLIRDGHVECPGVVRSAIDEDNKCTKRINMLKPKKSKLVLILIDHGPCANNFYLYVRGIPRVRAFACEFNEMLATAVCNHYNLLHYNLLRALAAVR